MHSSHFKKNYLQIPGIPSCGTSHTSDPPPHPPNLCGTASRFQRPNLGWFIEVTLTAHAAHVWAQLAGAPWDQRLPANMAGRADLLGYRFAVNRKRAAPASAAEHYQIYTDKGFRTCQTASVSMRKFYGLHSCFKAFKFNAVCVCEEACDRIGMPTDTSDPQSVLTLT